MGNQESTAAVAGDVRQLRPQQFITQAHSDWTQQMVALYSERPTLTKTVILPAGVDLNDPRLESGVVVSEKKYKLESGKFPDWPEDQPFECDVDGRLLPPCWGQDKVHAHFAIYPNKHFPELNCGYCELHNVAHPDLEQAPVHMASVTLQQTKAQSRRHFTEETRVPEDLATQISVSPDMGPVSEIAE